MEPARSTGNFSRRITSADGNSIVAILDLVQVNAKYAIFKNSHLVEIQALLEDVKITVNLPSLLPPPFPNINALMSEADKGAEIMKIRDQGQKISLGLYIAKGNGPWQYESQVVLQNYGGAEHHVPILVPFLSSNETLLMGEDFKLGVKIETKWQQPLKASATPFKTAIPHKLIKPTAAGTLRYSPLMASPIKPPMDAKGNTVITNVA